MSKGTKEWISQYKSTNYEMARTKTLRVVDKHHKAFCIFGASRYFPKPPTHTNAGRWVFYKPINHESNLIFTVQLIELLFKPQFLRKKTKLFDILMMYQIVTLVRSMNQ